MGSSIRDRDDWFDVWFEDRQAILETMIRNMASDLANGYDYFGSCIIRQRECIERYKAETDTQMDKFKEMEEKAVNRWCFYELKKRGAIL